MKLLIIGAMQVEIDNLHNHMIDVSIKEINNFTFYLGKIDNKDVVLTSSGIGKVMSGVLVATANAYFKDIDFVINLGVAGGYNGSKIGDVIIGEDYIYGDVDVTSFDTYKFGQIPRFEFPFKANSYLLEKATLLGGKKGTICTMDRFVEDDKFIKPLIDKHFLDFNILCFDMESTAFAQSASFFNLKFIAIRAISDVVSSNNDDEKYNVNLNESAKISSDFVLKLIELI